MDFAIVRFIDEEDAPGIVSTKWMDINRNICWYPNVRSEEKKNKLLRAHATPTPDWLKCPMRMLKTFSDYQSARHHLRRAEDTSNLDTDAECERPRKRTKKRNWDDSSDSTEEESESLLGQISSYPLPPPSSSLTFSSPTPALSLNYPPAPSSLTSSATSLLPNPPAASSLPYPPSTSSLKNAPPAVASTLNLNNEALNNKMDIILKNQNNIWRLLEEVIETNKRLERKMDIMATNQAPVSHIAQEDEEEIRIVSLLPLGVQDFPNFDKKIAESGFRKRLLNLCLTIGGKDVKLLICNIMRKLMQDDVGEIYSLTGKSASGMKYAFEKTETYKLILEICLRNFKEFKLNLAREAISDWLMQSKFRKSKREKRSAKSGEEERSLAIVNFVE